MPVPATAVGVYVAEQLAEFPLPLRVQVPVPLKVPVPLLVNMTVPLGVLAVPVPLSETVALQVVGMPPGTEAGKQLTLVPVGRSVVVAATTVPPFEPSCVRSPP